jgi:hypothetical protein
MAREKFASLTWRARRMIRSAGWPAMLALALLVFEASFHFSAMRPLAEQQAALHGQVSRQERVAAQSTAHAEPVQDPRQELGAFYGALARPADAPDLLRRLHRAARDQGVILDQADYRPLPDPEGGLTRYQIVLPAKGTYPEVRRFLVRASADVPGLAIDSVMFQRQQVGEAHLDAQIKLTLFLGT